MKKLFYLVVFFLCWIELPLTAGNVRLLVNAGRFERQDCIVAADVSSIPLKEGYEFVLFELNGKKKVPVASQLVVEDGKALLYFTLEGITQVNEVREFLLKTKKPKARASFMEVEDDSNSLIVKKDGRPVLAYKYTITMPPAGVDPIFQRSGYIHPAFTPSGFVLTTIQPKDHRHHYGIWNPWTKLEYDGTIYDLWNLGDKKGTVRASTIERTYQGSMMSGFDARLSHVIFKSGGEKKIMDELWKVKAWHVGEGFLWDFESDLMPSTNLPVLLKEYRYAGFGYRANEIWTNKNCIMMTSEGNSRQKIDGSRARWIYITGTSPAGHSGLLFLGAPDNYNSPEPLRIWDENANGGRGDAFINFAPTKNMDWNLESGKKYKLRYRLYAYDGEMAPERADELWNDFAYPPTVELISK